MLKVDTINGGILFTKFQVLLLELWSDDSISSPCGDRGIRIAPP
jgi:hypothetical protein